MNTMKTAGGRGKETSGKATDKGTQKEMANDNLNDAYTWISTTGHSSEADEGAVMPNTSLRLAPDDDIRRMMRKDAEKNAAPGAAARPARDKGLRNEGRGPQFDAKLRKIDNNTRKGKG